MIRTEIFTNSHIQPIDLTKSPVANRFTETYNAFYGFNFPDVDHYLGYIELSNFSIATQIFKPVSSIGTVIVVHGYFDHSAMMLNCIRTCVENGFTVAAIDLPGHGLSSGKRASIQDFLDYAIVLDQLTSFCSQHLPKPFHFIGHSTGCAAALEWMYTSELVNSNCIEKIFFLAPLIHSSVQILSQIMCKILKSKVNEIPSFYYPTTSNPVFEAFRKNDPLRPSKFPLEWFDAEVKWNLRMRKRGLLDRELHVIQGNIDRVVDWKYNIRFLSKKVKKANVYYVKDARHQLHNERLDYRMNVLEIIKNNLNVNL